MKIIRICVLLFLFFMSGQLQAQPYFFKLKVYNADDLIKIWEDKGLDALKGLVSPINLVYLDQKYADKLIDIEFKSGFVERHPDNAKYFIMNTPDLTLEIAKNFGGKKAYRKLFQYYCSIPKVVKSDTLYKIYNNLEEYFGVLIYYNSSSVVLRLVDDYHIWRDLIKTAPQTKKKVLSKKEIMKLAEEEIKKPIRFEDYKFRKSDLYNDPRDITLQLAGVLNYLGIRGFDRKLLDYLQSIQNRYWLMDYSFTGTRNPEDHPFKPDYKTIKSKSPITSFKKDYKLIWNLIEKGGVNGTDSQIYELIVKGNLAYIHISRSTSSTDYLVKIINKNAIAVAELSSALFNPAF